MDIHRHHSGSTNDFKHIHLYRKVNAILWLRKGHEYLGYFWWKSWSFNVFWIHFPTFSCADFFLKYTYLAESGIWSLLECAIQIEIFSNLVIWTISSQFYIERCFDFCKGNLFNYLSRSVSFHVKIRQIWLAVSCIVSVCFGGGGGCTWEYHGKTQRFRWGTFLCGAPVMLKLWKNWLMVDGAGFTFGAVPQFERSQEFVGKTHMFPFFGFVLELSC